MRLRHLSIVWIAVFIAWGGPGVAWAVENSSDLLPDIPRGQGESCVADTRFMRLNHMTLLGHQRDETIHQGIRSKPYSLKNCIACHVVTGPDAMPVTVASPDHFCRTCHDYVAVSIDCFQCHASRPEIESGPGSHGGLVLGAAGE